jgi:hypothetical protein
MKQVNLIYLSFLFPNDVSGDIEDAADGLKYKVGIYSGYDIVEHNAERA